MKQFQKICEKNNMTLHCEYEIPPYTCDMYIQELNLIIEINGIFHYADI